MQNVSTAPQTAPTTTFVKGGRLQQLQLGAPHKATCTETHRDDSAALSSARISARRHTFSHFLRALPAAVSAASSAAICQEETGGSFMSQQEMSCPMCPHVVQVAQ